MADRSDTQPIMEDLNGAAPVVSNGDTSKRWPLVFAFVTSWICPARTARRLAHIGLLKAFLFHTVCAAGLFAGIILLVCALEEGVSLADIWRELRSEVNRNAEAFFTDVATALGIGEAVVIGIAMLVVPWGARDEKLRWSFYHGLRVTWLQSAHAAVAMLLQAAFMLFWVRYTFTIFGSWRDRPWYSRHTGEIFSYALCLFCSWGFWGLLRAAGARREQRPANVPPTCQVCGYNLTATPMEGMCPECGEPAVESVGPHARMGIDWERKGRLGMRRSWWLTLSQAIRSPRRFGRDLQVYSRPADHRRFLLINMVLAAMLAVVGATFWLLGFVAGPGPYLDMWDDWIWVTAPLSGLVTGLSVLGASLLFAGVLGLALSPGSGRNVLPAAMRCSAYLSGFFVPWVIANLPLAWLYGYDRDMVRPLSSWLQVGEEETALAIWIGFNLIGLCTYLRLLHVSVTSARFADR